MIDAATERVRQDWDSQANNWYRQREALLAASRPIHEWLVDRLEAREGQRVLEIAAGPGDTGFLAAPRLGATGRLVSTDLSPVMVDAARRRAEEIGVRNAEFRILDAQAMNVADESFDSVICRWGIMLMPDPDAALSECRRVLVPGGRFVFAVFTGPEENPFASLPAKVLTDAGHMPKPASSGWRPGILALGDRSRLESVVTGAGFASLDIEPVEMTWRFADANDYWNFLVDLTAMGPLVRSLTDAAQRDVRATIDARLERFTQSDGVALPSRCWCGVATR